MPGHTGVVPVIVPGVAGVPALTTTAKLFAALVPQLFPAVTVILPPVVPDVTVTVVVPCPPVIVHPAGTAHV